jgi:hypothetical protein
MLTGGIADKIGNEYEVRWTLIEALRVLRGLADEIRLEPFNEDAGGLEFRITSDEIDEWHQCKRQRSSGTWTIHGLKNVGVLQAFAAKLAQDNARCVFVSSDPAPAFEKLIEKAQFAQNADDFYGDGGIGKTDEAPLRELNAAWSVDSTTQFSWLKRCRVEVISDASLLRQLEQLCDLLFKTAPGLVIDRLARYLLANLGRRLTSPILTSMVPELGIEWRAQFDETLDSKIGTATDEYLGTLSTKIAGLELDTTEIDLAVHTALDGDTPVTVLAGGAGSGKSVALSRMITEARRRGWPVLAFRIDRHLDVQSLHELGKSLLDNDESPVSTFGNRNLVRSALLVVDQVDAVSEASGRSGRIRDLFFRMIEQCSFFPDMRVVAACRSYDLDSDTRLKMLTEAKRVTAFRLKPLEWGATVEPVLLHLGIIPDRFSEREKQLLSVPINLSLFASVVESGDDPVGELSSTRLFDKLMEVRGRDLRLAGYKWTPEASLGAIAKSMSDNQDLTAPIAILDQFVGAVDALGSRGLITAVRGKVQFTHESFFDHTFSRHFISTGQSVHALLVSAEQRLFRRTQVRQIFSRLRDSSPDRYLVNLREVMESADIRYLVKDAIAYWLSEVDNPTLEECAIAQRWFNPHHPLERLARIVFNGKYWLPIVQQSGLLARWVDEGGTKKELAFWLLNKGSVGHLSLVTQFMRDWWQADRSARSSELISWFESLYPAESIDLLEQLYADVITALPPSAIKEVLADNFELGSWTHKYRPLGARIFGLWVRKWMAVFPTNHPFASSHGNNESYWIDELSKHEPEALLEAIAPPLSEALAREAAALKDGTIAYPTITPPHYEHDQELLRSTINALESISQSGAKKAERFLDILGCCSDVAIFCRLKAIAANGEKLFHLLPPLLDNARAFKVGDGDGDWLPFAKAAASAMPYLPQVDRDRVERCVLAYRPEFQWALAYAQDAKTGQTRRLTDDAREYISIQLKLSGRDERAILTTIGSEHLSLRSRQRLAELDRKFVGEVLPHSHSIRGGFVRSPIDLDKARLMSDAQWIRAMEKYRGNNRRVFEPNGVIGGSRELASIFQARTKEDPERFVALLERLPIETIAEYAEALLSGLRDSETDATLVVRGLKIAMRLPERDCDKTINWTVQKHPSTATDAAILAHVLNSARIGSASDTSVRTSSAKQRAQETAAELLEAEDDLFSSGINGERGSAYEALANVLWNEPSTLPVILDLLDRQVELEPLTSVRLCITHSINSVGKYDSAKAVSLLQRLASRDIRVLQARAARHMLNWAAYNHANAISGFIIELLKSETLSLRALGYFLESLLALLNEDRNIIFVSGFRDNALRRQMAALRGSSNVTSDHYGARAVGWLLALFGDDDALVRGDTTQINWDEYLDTASDPTALANTYVASRTFDDHSDRLVRALEARVSQFPALTFDAVEKVLKLSDEWTDERRKGHYLTLHHLGRLLVELYRSVLGGSDHEKRILDLFDLYLARDLQDLRNAIGAYERH